MALSKCAAATSREGRELACHGQAEFPIACYHDDLSRNPVPWHWHPELEALVVVEGTAEVAVGAERFTVGPGEGVFISVGILHAAWALGESDCRIHSAVFHPPSGGRRGGQRVLVQIPPPPAGRGGPGARPAGRLGGLAQPSGLCPGRGLGALCSGAAGL